VQCYLPKTKHISPDCWCWGICQGMVVVITYLSFLKRLRVEIPPPQQTRACGMPSYRLAGHSTAPAQVETVTA